MGRVISAAGALAFGLFADQAFGASSLSWTEARAQADALVAQMTSAEKENVTYGHPGLVGCSGQTGAVPRLNVPPFCLQDAGAGVRYTDFVNAYASGISVAASWNIELAYQRAAYMGAEFKRKGNHAALGPFVGPIGRTVTGGRNFEGFGSDPYLAGKLAAVSVEGLQENVIATIKHFLFNEQEYLRQELGERKALSTNVDDVATHELYMWPFQDAVRSDVGSVMCSYNRVNGSYASENDYLLNNLLKGELDFPGYVVSDWGAQHSGAPSAAAGLDIAMPSSNTLWTGNLQGFVDNGTITQARFDDMVARTLTAWYKVIGGPDTEFPESGIGMPSQLTSPHSLIDARDPASKPTILQGAVEGHVLVKNTNNALPLKQPKLLSLYGTDAIIPKRYYPGEAAAVDFEFVYGLQSSGKNTSTIISLLAGGNTSGIDPQATGGILWNGAGSGANNPSALSDTYGAIQQRARRDDTYLYWDFTGNNITRVHPLSTACLVLINELGSEAIDRPGTAAPLADQLVISVASQCRNTIVAIHNPAVRTVDAWIDNENVTAVVFAHLGGQEVGESLAQVLYGEESPSGRLPYTVAEKPSDYGPLLEPCAEGDIATLPYCNFTEGIYTDYRYFQKNGLTPRFAFGYGLTYSSFNYSDFEVSWVDGADLSTSPPDPEDIAPGGIQSLFDVVAKASVVVSNTGDVLAAEVPQLYVHFPTEDQPVHFLRGFGKVPLEPCEHETVEFELTRRDLSRWNPVTQSWELASGELEFRLGKSVVDIVDTKTLSR